MYEKILQVNFCVAATMNELQVERKDNMNKQHCGVWLWVDNTFAQVVQPLLQGQSHINEYWKVTAFSSRWYLSPKQ